MKLTNLLHMIFLRRARVLALAGALAVLPDAGLLSAAAQTRASTPPAAAPAPTGAAATKSGHDSFGRMSKFEARRIRHACHDHANERNLKGAERDAFMMKCFFGRASHRGLRRECAREGEARVLDKGLDKAALREFTRECVKERSRPKD